jgi:hypothetical protein
MTGSRPEDDKLRSRIAAEAARLAATSGDSARARLRAARRVAGGWVPDHQLPSHAAIRGGFGHLVGDRFDRLADLLRPLEAVRQDPARHPEGDALEHSLQVFDIVREETPYDEELLTAALVHDVGKAIDRGDHVAAGLAAVAELITPRTRWLIESLAAAHGHADGTLGTRARHRLEAHPDFHDALRLAAADRRGRQRGYPTPSLEEAIQFLRGLEAQEA